jgi:hypothetical protein
MERDRRGGETGRRAIMMRRRDRLRDMKRRERHAKTGGKIRRRERQTEIFG